ncbi:MAG: hypothetical protein S4CHLAM102_15720 [Chlamydiia bacterium]|nr:hypothetical protein [Chlamydiia bacterium]
MRVETSSVTGYLFAPVTAMKCVVGAVAHSCVQGVAGLFQYCHRGLREWEVASHEQYLAAHFFRNTRTWITAQGSGHGLVNFRIQSYDAAMKHMTLCGPPKHYSAIGFRTELDADEQLFVSSSPLASQGQDEGFIYCKAFLYFFGANRESCSMSEISRLYVNTCSENPILQAIGACGFKDKGTVVDEFLISETVAIRFELFSEANKVKLPLTMPVISRVETESQSVYFLTFTDERNFYLFDPQVGLFKLPKARIYALSTISQYVFGRYGVRVGPLI